MPRKPWLRPDESPRAFQHLIEPYERLWWACFDCAVRDNLGEADREVVLAQVTGPRPV